MRNNLKNRFGGGFSLEEHQQFRFDVERWPVPKATLENDSLVFSTRSKEVALPNTLLEEFTDLAEADGATICRFANRWGRLELCEHDLPQHTRYPAF